MYVYNRDDATRKDIENFDSEIQEKTNRNVARWQQLEFRYTHTHTHLHTYIQIAMSMITPSVNSTKRKIYRTKMRAKEELIGVLRQMVENTTKSRAHRDGKAISKRKGFCLFRSLSAWDFFSSRIYHLGAFFVFCVFSSLQKRFSFVKHTNNEE